MVQKDVYSPVYKIKTQIEETFNIVESNFQQRRMQKKKKLNVRGWFVTLHYLIVTTRTHTNYMHPLDHTNLIPILNVIQPWILQKKAEETKWKGVCEHGLPQTTQGGFCDRLQYISPFLPRLDLNAILHIAVGWPLISWASYVERWTP